MHASPQQLPFEEPGKIPALRPVPATPKLEQRMLRFLRLLRTAFWRALSIMPCSSGTPRDPSVASARSISSEPCFFHLSRACLALVSNLP